MSKKEKQAEEGLHKPEMLRSLSLHVLLDSMISATLEDKSREICLSVVGHSLKSPSLMKTDLTDSSKSQKKDEAQLERRLMLSRSNILQMASNMVLSRFFTLEVYN